MAATSSVSLSGAGLMLAPVEATSSFLRGSVLGPEAVAAELERIELFEPEAGRDLEGLAALQRFLLAEEDRVVPRALDRLAELTAGCLDRGLFPLTLGGEHTVSLGPLRAVLDRWGPVGLVQLDAHGDLRPAYEGTRWSHACVMRRAVEDLGLPLLGIGIRSVCPEEVAFVQAHAKVRHLPPWKLWAVRSLEATLSEALSLLPERVYLTIDMDAFDPAVAPGVGTPEAGGLSWFQVAEIIDVVARGRTIVGADIVELAPAVERERTVRLAARVAVRVLARALAPR